MLIVMAIEKCWNMYHFNVETRRVSPEVIVVSVDKRMPTRLKNGNCLINQRGVHKRIIPCKSDKGFTLQHFNGFAKFLVGMAL